MSKHRTETPDAEYRVVVVNAGTSEPSSTAMLASKVLNELTQHAEQRGAAVRATTVELRDLAQEIATGLVTGHVGDGVAQASRRIAEADAVIAATPVYKAESSGLFSGFFQLLDRDALVGTPVMLGATAGTARHALVVDGALRSQFAYLRALVAPTGLFAAPDDWNDPAFSRRVRRAAGELWLLMASGFALAVRESNWDAYQHDFGSVKAATAEAGGAEINLDTDLMRLAQGGSAR